MKYVSMMKLWNSSFNEPWKSQFYHAESRLDGAEHITSLSMMLIIAFRLGVKLNINDETMVKHKNQSPARLHVRTLQPHSHDFLHSRLQHPIIVHI